MSEERALYQNSTTEMTTQELELLQVQESRIQSNLFGYNEVVSALYVIWEKRLYRSKYSSFDSYLKTRWNTLHLSRSRVLQLLALEELKNDLLSNVTNGNKIPGVLPTVLPENERQIRPLSQLPREDRPAAWELAVEENDGNPPSGAQVAEVVHRLDFADFEQEPVPPILEENYQSSGENQVKAEILRSDTPKKAFGYLTDISTDFKNKKIWCTFVSPPNPATGKKEYKTKFLSISWRELVNQGWTAPEPDSEEDEATPFAPEPVRPAEAPNPFKGKAQTIDVDASFFNAPGSFLTPEQQAVTFSEAGL